MLGAGMGLCSSAHPRDAADVPREEIAGATGLSQLVRQLGGSFGIAVITTLLTRQTARLGPASRAASRRPKAPKATLVALLAQASTVLAYDYVFRLSALFILAIPLILFVKPRDVDAAAGAEAPRPELCAGRFAAARAPVMSVMRTFRSGAWSRPKRSS